MTEQPDVDMNALRRSVYSTFPRNTAQLAHEIDEAIQRYGLKPEIIVTHHPEMGKFLQRVIAERQKQDDKWGRQDHDPVEWVSILVEEVGEAAEQANKAYWFHSEVGVDKALRLEKLIDELVQIAAVATAFYESLCRNEIAALNNLEANGDE